MSWQRNVPWQLCPGNAELPGHTADRDRVSRHAAGWSTDASGEPHLGCARRRICRPRAPSLRICHRDAHAGWGPAWRPGRAGFRIEVQVASAQGSPRSFDALGHGSRSAPGAAADPGREARDIMRKDFSATASIAVRRAHARRRGTRSADHVEDSSSARAASHRDFLRPASRPARSPAAPATPGAPNVSAVLPGCRP